MVTNKQGASFLIVNYRQSKHVASLVKKIAKTFKYDYEILVFNNYKFTFKTYFSNFFQFGAGKNIGYSKAVNYLSIQARYKYLYIINPDIEITNDLALSYQEFLKKPLKYAVYSLSSPDSIYFQPFIGKFLRSEKRFSGAAFIVYKEYFKVLGGFDPNYFMYFEDSDFALKLKKFGLKTFFPKVQYVRHLKTYTNVAYPKRKLYYYESLLYYLKKNFFKTYYFYYLPLKFLTLYLKILRNQ